MNDNVTNKMDKVKDFFRSSIGYVAIFLLCALYLCVSFVSISKTGKTVGEIVADTALAFVFGICLNSVFELQGILDGDRDPRMIATSRLHAETIDRISPHIEELSDWCDAKNSTAMKMQRVRILASCGLKYDDCFTEDGVALPYVPANYRTSENLIWWRRFKEEFRIFMAERSRYRCYEQAIKLSITPLTASVLTSEGGRPNDPFYLGRTKLEYERTQTVKTVITRVLTATIFGYYGASLIENFKWSSLVWVVLQIGIFAACGVISYYSAMMFVTDEYRGRIIKKIDNLQAFENFIKSKGGKENVEHD